MLRNIIRKQLACIIPSKTSTDQRNFSGTQQTLPKLLQGKNNYDSWWGVGALCLPSKRCYSAATAAYGDWNDFPGHQNVLFLTASNIDSYIRQTPALLIIFYAPWCIHCKSSKNEFAKAAMLLTPQLPHAKLAAIDCILYPTVYEKFKVTGYPTFFYFRNGKCIGEYNGRRSAAEFVQFMLREPKSRAEL